MQLPDIVFCIRIIIMNHYEEQGDEDWWLPDLAQHVDVSRDVEIPRLEYHSLKQEDEEELFTNWAFVPEHEPLDCRFPASIDVWYERLPFDSSNHLEQKTASSRSIVEVRVTPPQEQQLRHELAHHSSKNRKKKQRRQQRNQKQACRVYANQSRPVKDLPRKCRSMF